MKESLTYESSKKYRAEKAKELPKILYRDDGMEFHLQKNKRYAIARHDCYAESHYEYTYEVLMSHGVFHRDKDIAKELGRQREIGFRWNGGSLEVFHRGKWEIVPQKA